MQRTHLCNLLWKQLTFKLGHEHRICMAVTRAVILHFVDELVISVTWRDLTYVYWHVKQNYSNLFHAGFKSLDKMWQTISLLKI